MKKIGILLLLLFVLNLFITNILAQEVIDPEDIIGIGQEDLEKLEEFGDNPEEVSKEYLKQEWTKNDDGKDVRTIKEVKLFEVSPVPMPAYDGTTVTARGEKPQIPQEEQAEPVDNHSLEDQKGIKTDLLRARLNLKLKESGLK